MSEVKAQQCIAEKLSDSDYVEVAKGLMELIQLDNGYGHVVGISFPTKWVNSISKSAKIFFEANPDMYTDENLEIIAVGGEDDLDKFENLVGYKKLSDTLNNYFDYGMDTGKTVIKPRIEHTYEPIKHHPK